MPETLRLRVTHHYSPFRWAWTLTDDRELDLSSDAELMLDSPRHQELIDRARVQARTVDPTIRGRLRSTLIEVIGEEFASVLAARPIDELHVVAEPMCRVALTLPLEVLFDGPATLVVRELSGPRGQASRGDRVGGVLAGFALCPGDGYLCLHEEARLLTRAAEAGGHGIDELFITFTGDEFLALGRGRDVVHLAGHGNGAAMRCPRAMGCEPALTARDMIDAWRDAPPDVVVLNFCESSSERDVTHLLSLAARDTVELDEHLNRLRSTDGAATSSMAVDLAAGLVTAVVAMRTPVDDSAARRFAETLYREYLGRAAPLTDAFRSAMAAECSVDAAGVPIPTLYMSHRPEALATSSPRASPSASSHDRGRRYVNYFYNAFGALAPLLSQPWVCAVTGWESDVRNHVVAHLTELCARRYPEHGPPRIHQASESLTLIAGRPSGSERVAVQVDLESLPSAVPLVEVATWRGSLRPADARLLAYASCQVPSILEALTQAPITQVIEALRRTAWGRSAFRDRDLRWDLARELIAFLPDGPRRAVSAWSDAKWAAVERLGPLAVDVAACRFLLGDDFYQSEQTHRMLTHLAKTRDIQIDTLIGVLNELVDAGVASVSPDVVAGAGPEAVSIDLVTASRAWAACSDEAAASFISAQIESETAFLRLRDAADSVETMDIILLAHTCLEAGDDRLWPLLDLLCRRGADSTAQQLGEAAAAAGFVRDASREELPGWAAIIEDLHQGRFSAVSANLDDVDTSTAEAALQLRVVRLAMGGDRRPPHELIEQIDDLVEEVLAESRLGLDAHTTIVLLNALRQVASSAFEALGDTEASLSALVQHWHEVSALDGGTIHQVHAGALLARRLQELKRFQEARELVDHLVVISADAGPSLTLCWPLALDLSLLALEGRLSRIPASAERLVELLRNWESPRVDILRHCLAALGAGELALDHGSRGLAWFALADYVTPEGVATSWLELAAYGREIYSVAEADIIDAAADLTEVVGPLLARARAHDKSFIDFVSTWLASLPQPADVDTLARAIGAEEAAALRERADAGCAFARLAVRGISDTYEPDDLLRLPDDWDPVSFEAVVGVQPPLGTLLARAVPEKFLGPLPVLRAAYAGNLDARIAFMGVLAGDFQLGMDAAGGLSEIYVRLARGEAWRTVGTVIKGLQGRELIQAAIAAEECLLVTGGSDPTAATASLLKLSGTAWASLIDQAPRDLATARAAIRMLFSSTGAGVALEMINRGGLPPEIEAADNGPAQDVARRISASAAARVALGRAAVAEGQPDVGVAILRAAKEGDTEADTIAAGVALLEHFVEIGDRDSGRQELEELLGRAGELEAGSDAWVQALQHAGNGAIRLDDLKTAEAINHTLAYGPGEAQVFEVRLTASFNLLSVLVAQERFDDACRHFDAVCSFFGFSAACWMLEPVARGLPQAVRSQMSGSLRAVMADGRSDLLAGHLRSAREGLLEVMESEPGWTEALPVVLRSLEEDLHEGETALPKDPMQVDG